jgi:hypothetical protein
MLVWRPFQRRPAQAQICHKESVASLRLFMTEVVGAAFLARAVHDDTFLSEIF